MYYRFDLFKAPIILKKTSFVSYSHPRASIDDNGNCTLWCMEHTVDGVQTIEIKSAEFQAWTSPSSSSVCLDEKRKDPTINRNGKPYSVVSSSTGKLSAMIGNKSRVLELDTERIPSSDGNAWEPCLVEDPNSGFLFLFYQTAGSIVIAVSMDGIHYLSFLRDTPTYPTHGFIHDGDYYDSIPFSSYIHKMPLPDGYVVDVRDYGAVPNARFISTPAFYAAFDNVTSHGGGTVLVTGGTYCVGTLNIPSNVVLFIDVDSAISASKDLSRFHNMFVGCIGAENVTITGGGRIIGNGEYFVYPPESAPALDPLPLIKLPAILYDSMGYPVDSLRYAYRRRIRYAIDEYGKSLPPIPRPLNHVWIRKSKNVRIENITIKSAFEWSLNLEASRNLMVKDVIIDDNRHVANTDGIDITSCENVTINHCFISCADDGLCIKAPKSNNHDGRFAELDDYSMGPTKHVKITNCTVLTVMNSLKFGTGTYYDIEDVVVEDCTFMLPDIFPGSTSGIAIESADGGHVRDIVVRNIHMENICCPIFICLNMRNCDGYESQEDFRERQYGGSIERILIEHIDIVGAEIPSLITGFRNIEGEKPVVRRVNDITIRDYHCIYRDDKESIEILPHIHENIREYPESNAFGDVPAYGFFIRHGRNITLEEISVIPRSMNTRPCLIREDVDG